MVDGAFSLVNIYSTKGLEYLIAGVFFISMIFLVKKVIYYKPWRRIKVLWDKK